MNKWFASTIIQGLLFAMLWASASVAGKYGLLYVEPLVLFNVRFALAGILLLGLGYLIQRNRIPRLLEFKQLAIFATFNAALYLGFFVLALDQVAAGITALAVAMNPLFIGLMTAIYTRKGIRPWNLFGILIGLIGVGLASYPLLGNGFATWQGLILLVLSMLSYSFGAVYYASVKWELPRMMINAWQVMIAALLLLPMTLLLHERENQFNVGFWLSELWLVVMVSVFAVQLWLGLLKRDAVSASLWLYLCPIFGFIYATLLLGEPFTFHTAFGGGLVILALYLGQKKG